MRNDYRLHPIRRYRTNQLGDFPLLESVSATMRENNGLAAEPAKLPVNQSDTRPVPLAGQVDDPQANSSGQAAAISRQGDAMRPSGAECVDAAAAMENAGKDLAAAGNAMPATPDNEKQTIPAGRPDETSPDQSDTAMAAAPSAVPIPSESTGDKVSKIPFRQQVENWLKREKLPYIRVDEAKRALFAGARLRSFHFVVYMAKTGPNWLVWAGPLNRECRVDMQQWESIFGDGFVAVIARPSRSNDRGFSLQTLAGQTLPYPNQEIESQPQSQPAARPVEPE